MARLVRALGALLLLAAASMALSETASAGGSKTLDAVRARGVVLCGISGATPGFSLTAARADSTCADGGAAGARMSNLS